jgi:hypothetical protein
VGCIFTAAKEAPGLLSLPCAWYINAQAIQTPSVVVKIHGDTSDGAHLPDLFATDVPYHENHPAEGSCCVGTKTKLANVETAKAAAAARGGHTDDDRFVVLDGAEPVAHLEIAPSTHVGALLWIMSDTAGNSTLLQPQGLPSEYGGYGLSSCVDCAAADSVNFRGQKTQSLHLAEETQGHRCLRSCFECVTCLCCCNAGGAENGSCKPPLISVTRPMPTSEARKKKPFGEPALAKRAGTFGHSSPSTYAPLDVQTRPGQLGWQTKKNADKNDTAMLALAKRLAGQEGAENFAPLHASAALFDTEPLLVPAKHSRMRHQGRLDFEAATGGLFLNPGTPVAEKMVRDGSDPDSVVFAKGDGAVIHQLGASAFQASGCCAKTGTPPAAEALPEVPMLTNRLYFRMTNENNPDRPHIPRDIILRFAPDMPYANRLQMLTMALHTPFDASEAGVVAKTVKHPLFAPLYVSDRRHWRNTDADALPDQQVSPATNNPVVAQSEVLAEVEKI